MATVDKAINLIQEAGFGYLKMELEADLSRGMAACPPCTGNGRQPCTECSELGYHSKKVFGAVKHTECSVCLGRGVMLCPTCNGNGSGRINFGDISFCNKFILNHVCQEIYGVPLATRVRDMRLRPLRSVHGSYDISRFHAIEGLTYCEFYNDGSVDSEITVTMELSRAKELSVAFINAFNALAKANGRGMNVQGAGLHTTVLLKDTKGKYPNSPSRGLRSSNLANFTREVTKLLPSLYFCSSPTPKTRIYNYRMPKISTSKYSAIHLLHAGFEYRVFDTCYEKPEAFYDYLWVIAGTLRFYKDKKATVKELGKEFKLFEKRSISAYCEDEDNLRILNSQIAYLKPEGKSYKKMREERGVYTSITKLRQARVARQTQLRKDYRALVEQHMTLLKSPLSQREEERVASRMAYYGTSYNKAVAVVRGMTETFPSWEAFLRDNDQKSVPIAAKIKV